MKNYALLFDFGVLPDKLPLFPLQHTHEISEEGQKDGTAPKIGILHKRREGKK
jgi:hypothetical protein